MKAMTNNTSQGRCSGGSCYPNGLAVLLVAQICLLAGMLFSTAAVMDCEFVVADIDVANGHPIPSQLVGLLEGDDRRRGLGFFTHEDNDGNCRWKTWDEESASSDEIEEYTEDYVDWLDSDWEGPRGTALASMGLSVAFLVWLFVYCCVAHPRFLRYTIGTLVAVLLSCLQYASFSVIDSDFCDGRNCEMGRSGGFAVTAGILFLVAGVLCFFTRDYPGQQDGIEGEQEKAVPVTLPAVNYGDAEASVVDVSTPDDVQVVVDEEPRKPEVIVSVY